MSDDLPTSVWQGTFTILGVTLHCHVLSNGKRIIEANDLAALLERMGGGEIIDNDAPDFTNFARWQKGMK